MITALLVSLGAAVGAPIRYLVDRAIRLRWKKRFPLGTFCVNISGSLILGFSAALSTDPAVNALINIGFCGALTTYSTFSFETLRLIQTKAWAATHLNVMISLITGLGAAYCGMAIARVFT